MHPGERNRYCWRGRFQKKAASVEWVAAAEKLAALVAAAAAALANVVSAGCLLALLRMHVRLFPAPAESRLPTRIRGRHESLHGAEIAGHMGEGRQQRQLTCGSIALEMK